MTRLSPQATGAASRRTPARDEWKSSSWAGANARLRPISNGIPKKRAVFKPHDASLSIRLNTASFYCYTLPGNRPRSNPAAAKALKRIFDRVDSFLKDNLLRGMVELLTSQPTPMRQRPVAAAAVNPVMPEEEREKPLTL